MMTCAAAVVLLMVGVPAPAEVGWVAPMVRPGDNGLPVQVLAPEIGPESLLTGPCEMTVTPEDGEPLPVRLQAVADGAYRQRWDEQGVALEVAYGAEVLPFMELRCQVEGVDERRLTVEMQVPVVPSADRAFWPAGEAPRISLEAGAEPVTYGYRSGGMRCAMPLAQVYSVAEDRGLAVCGDMGGLLVEPLRFDAQRNDERTLLTLSWELTIEAGERVTRRVFFAATRGDWRPALGAVLAAFPQSFEPHHPDVDALHGPFGGGGPRPDEEIQSGYDQGCRAVEIHGWSPFYGRYVPEREPWTPFCDDRWNRLKQRFGPDERPADDATWREIRAFVEQHHPPSLTVEKMNDYIARLHAHGIRGLIYFNPTEAWAPWAAEMFPDDRRLDPDGNPIPVWYESCSMIPDRDRPWGRYLLDQIRGELETFPEVDGVFFDQSAGGGHDLTRLCAEGCRIVRAQGKLCWWNGPYNMELAALADGMMTEGGGTERYRVNTQIIQYYAIGGKPIVSFGPWVTPALCEMLDRAVYPKTISLATESQREIHDRWSPLFLALRNRRWVLEAHALDAPEEISANLYRVRDGNLALVLVPEPYRDDDADRLWDVPVTVRVPEAPRVRGAYLHAPDLLGAHRLPFERDGEAITLRVPRLGPAALVVLATAGTWSSLDGPLHLVRGADSTVRWRVDNWTEQPQPLELAVECPWGSEAAERTIAAGESAHVELPIVVPHDFDGERVEMAVSAHVAGEERGGRAELWVDPPVMLAAQAPEQIRDDEPLEVTARLLSHLPDEAEVILRAASDAFAFKPTEQTVSVSSEQADEIRLTGTATLAGDARSVTVSISGTGVEPLTVTQAVDVLATAIRPDGFAKIRSAELLLDVFGVGGGRYEHKPITINGIEIGNVPRGGGDTWVNDRVVALTQEAIASLREHNEIEIGNEVADAFKVRNLRLHLHMPGSVTIVSATDTGVYTGWTDWLYGEGRQFPAGEPLTGIAVDIPVDPGRPERYEELFGTAAGGRLVLEIAGSDGGAYAHKVVSVNGRPIGELPGSGSEWSEHTMELTAEALAALSERNQVVIENSAPPDAFKVRRARIEIENEDGERFVTATDQGAYTSVGWKYAEGTVGSPIRIELTVTRE